jgi:hypothetical protein
MEKTKKKDYIKVFKSLDEDVMAEMMANLINAEEKGEVDDPEEKEKVEKVEPESTKIEEKETVSYATIEEVNSVNEKLEKLLSFMEKSKPFGVTQKVKNTKPTHNENDITFDDVFAKLKRNR